MSIGGRGFLKSINQSSFYGTNISGIASISGATAESVFKSEINIRK